MDETTLNLGSSGLDDNVKCFYLSRFRVMSNAACGF